MGTRSRWGCSIATRSIQCQEQDCFRSRVAASSRARLIAGHGRYEAAWGGPLLLWACSLPLRALESLPSFRWACPEGDGSWPAGPPRLPSQAAAWPNGPTEHINDFTSDSEAYDP
jgi:hypothetical protein